MNLSDMNEGQIGVITCIDKENICCRRLFDLGFSGGENARCLFKNPFGSPIAYSVGGTIIALRKSDAVKIGVVI